MLSKKLKPILNKGDKVGLITPAGFITNQKLETAVNNLSNLDLEAVYLPGILDKYGYLAGKDEDRVEELHKMYSDKSIKAILCVRGGSGSSRIIDLINYDLIRSNPKPVIGYSDITALLISIYNKTKIPGFHGIIGAEPFTEYISNNFRDIFMKNNERIIINNHINGASESYVINSGITTGKIIGGNLSILCSLLGTPFDDSWDNKIVFIEEVNEAPYKIDRMLTQLILAGKFKKIKGIILGQFSKCNPKDFEIQKDDSLTLTQIIEENIKPLNIPAVYGFSFGHIDNQAIIPIGVDGIFNADKFQIEIKRRAFEVFF